MSVKTEYYDVIRKPIITEKATLASEAGAVVFEVARDSNKPKIKDKAKKNLISSLQAVVTSLTLRCDGLKRPYSSKKSIWTGIKKIGISQSPCWEKYL